MCGTRPLMITARMTDIILCNKVNPLIHLKPAKVFDFDPIILIVMLLYLIYQNTFDLTRSQSFFSLLTVFDLQNKLENASSNEFIKKYSS